MARSALPSSGALRVHLLAWYTAILALVIALFGGTVCYLVWRAQLADIDVRLHARVRALSSALQPAPEDTFDLTLPAEDARVAAGEDHVYYALWTARGDLIDRSTDVGAITRPDGPGVRTIGGRREVTMAAAHGVLILAGQDLSAARREVWSLAGLIASVGAGALALSLAGGWLLVGRALAPLHASLQRQRRFTADASHELRTPLASISTEVQWALARDRTADEYRESLAICRRAADRMASVTTRLLALARAEAAEPDRTVPVALDDVVRRALDGVGPELRRRDITVTVTAAPLTVAGDPDRLLEAVSQVVSNAVQYNVDHGTVSIALREDRQRAVLEVTDTGVGIAASDLPRVFEPFFRADPARSREPGGAGLGLAVARAIVRGHGGEISCASRPDVGTAVIVRLPVSAVTS
jgi:signal transduction histidine kinase